MENQTQITANRANWTGEQGTITIVHSESSTKTVFYHDGCDYFEKYTMEIDRAGSVTFREEWSGEICGYAERTRVGNWSACAFKYNGELTRVSVNPIVAFCQVLWSL